MVYPVMRPFGQFQPGDLLQLEEEVWRADAVGAEAAATARGGRLGYAAATRQRRHHMSGDNNERRVGLSCRSG